MKKFIVLPLAILLLCGCSQSKDVTPILKDISFTAKITYSGDEYLCNTTIKDEALNLIVTEPQEIKDLTLTLDKNGVHAEFMGVSFEPDIDSLPQGAVAQVLWDVFDDVSAKKSVKCNGDNCVVKGTVDDHEYILTLAPSGLPIRLQIESLDFTVEFNNVTML